MIFLSLFIKEIALAQVLVSEAYPDLIITHQLQEFKLKKYDEGKPEQRDYQFVATTGGKGHIKIGGSYMCHDPKNKNMELYSSSSKDKALEWSFRKLKKEAGVQICQFMVAINKHYYWLQGEDSSRKVSLVKQGGPVKGNRWKIMPEKDEDENDEEEESEDDANKKGPDNKKPGTAENSDDEREDLNKTKNKIPSKKTESEADDMLKEPTKKDSNEDEGEEKEKEPEKAKEKPSEGEKEESEWPYWNKYGFGGNGFGRNGFGGKRFGGNGFGGKGFGFGGGWYGGASRSGYGRSSYSRAQRRAAYARRSYSHRRSSSRMSRSSRRAMRRSSSGGYYE